MSNTTTTMNPAVKQRIQDQIDSHNVVLYMKGTADFPQCGFSGQVVHILKQYQVDFKAINVLSDESIREGIKQFSHWPTIPQLYINGTFIGGCDIVSELHEKGELRALLG